MMITVLAQTVLIALKRIITWTLVCTSGVLILFFVADACVPLPEPPLQHYSRHLLATDGSVLSAWPASDGRWRTKTDIEKVSTRYLEALLAYEDRWYYYHPGINPFAFVRASFQAIKAGQIVSGGSTLTMQTARVLYPVERNLRGKALQCLRAVQLERRYSKAQILNLYLNNAPFGGTLHGVEAASQAYFGKSSAILSHAEAALLSVLPQAPSRLRPDRYPDRARSARDKVIRRMKHFSYWEAEIADRALMEPVRPRYRQQQLQAPLLAERLLREDSSALQTNIDAELQRRLERRLRNALTAMPDGVSLAVLVLENKSAKVRAYIGSGDYFDRSRYGAIDMIRAIRSPGSTLKPFIYGLGIDEGFIHSESLLADVSNPRAMYQPKNFDDSENGPVSVSEALQASLNIPAVQVLAHLGPEQALQSLRTTGNKLQLPAGSKASLAIALGGVGTNLESLVSLYRALDVDGKSAALRFTDHDEFSETQLLSPGAAWIIRDILTGTPRPHNRELGSSAAVAYKTGTSYGHRDAWAIGLASGHTIGVWVGRPDGTPLAEQYGAASAAPILFQLTDMLQTSTSATSPQRPHSVTQKKICWPQGRAEKFTKPGHCASQRDAWVLNGATPVTLALTAHKESLEQTILVDEQSGLRVNAQCAPGATVTRTFVQWPILLRPWRKQYPQLAQTPHWHSHCKNVFSPSQPLIISGVSNEAVLRPRPGHDSAQLRLSVNNAYGTVRWLHNGRPVPDSRSSANGQRLAISLAMAGAHTIVAVDKHGNSASVHLSLKKPRSRTVLAQVH